MPETPEYYEIVNWEKFQTYKAKRPAWIKIYTALQDKIEYRELADETKAHLHGLWLLAARIGSRIPNNQTYLAGMMGIMGAPQLMPRVGH